MSCGVAELEQNGPHLHFSLNFHLHLGLRIQKCCFLFLLSVIMIMRLSP